MANARAAQNQQLFNQAASIYGQMGMGVPAFTGKGGGGRLTAHLENVISQGRSMLADYQMRQMQNQFRDALRAQQSQPQRSITRELKSTLASGGGGVRRRRSRSQLMAQQQGVRASNQLQAGPYLGPQGGATATPYGSSINLA